MLPGIGLNRPPAIRLSIPPLKYINPHGSFDTYNTGGSIADETVAIHGQDRIYQVGGGYTGGILGNFAWDGSSAGIQALQRSWNLDFILNRNGVNSSPYPNYRIAPTVVTTAIGMSSASETTNHICVLETGNGYSTQWRVHGTAGSTLFSTSLGGWAYAGYAFRFEYTYSTDTIRLLGNTSGLFTGMSQLSSYTFSGANRSAFNHPNALFGIGGRFRAQPDGYRDIRFYEI